MPVHTIDRRALLRVAGIVSAAAFWKQNVTAAVPVVGAVDHLLLGAADLDQGIAWVEARTGIKPVIGGSHPGRGTRNALLSLGGKQYLEVIAPDPAQKTFTFQLDIRSLKEPRLVTWAAASTDLDALARRARDAGHQVLGPFDGSRVRPDGKVLKWRTMAVPNALGDGSVDPIPFFIQWAGDSVHPAQDSPKGCELKSLAIVHPKPSRVAETLSAFGIDAKVESGSAPVLRARLTTPKGAVEIS
jgi:hypothetical protein